MEGSSPEKRCISGRPPLWVLMLSQMWPSYVVRLISGDNGSAWSIGIDEFIKPVSGLAAE